MKREILFRSQRVDNNEWEKGFLVIDPKGESRIYFKPFDEVTSNTFLFVKPETVGQFTGLLDKNGKQIFEDDIVKVYEKINDEVKDWNNVVCFKSGCFSLYNPDCCEQCKNGLGITCTLNEAFYLGDIEVIGNIYDNPELLKK